MFRAGRTSISNGATSVSVAFGDTFSSAPTTIIGTVSNTAGSTSYFLLYPTVISAGTTSCTFELNGITDSTSYSISWIATDDSTITAGAGATGPTGATGAAAVPARVVDAFEHRWTESVPLDAAWIERYRQRVVARPQAVLAFRFCSSWTQP